MSTAHKENEATERVMAAVSKEDMDVIREHFPMWGSVSHIIRELIAGLAQDLREGKHNTSAQEKLLSQSKKLKNL